MRHTHTHTHVITMNIRKSHMSFLTTVKRKEKTIRYIYNFQLKILYHNIVKICLFFAPFCCSHRFCFSSLYHRYIHIVCCCWQFMNMLNYKNQKFIENDRTIEILDIHISIQRKNLLEIMVSVGRSDE